MTRHYQIVVQGEFGPLLAAAFEDTSIRTGNGRTVLDADVSDPGEFYGLLDRLRNFAIELVSVRELEVGVGEPGPGEADAPEE